ncbi:MAG: toll/interleukin-1 receptor domain-containing protein, partial [Clostridia bacterium]|nr:toll/interleukin-1 receptor domain-containing protein [Clostridia bacterium]
EKDGLHDKKKYVETWYKKALDAVNDAIRLDPGYAKFYCTKGRIVCIDKKHAEAINNVDKAIGTESSERSDYALRLSYYQYHKMMINTDRKLCELEERFKLTGDIVARPDEASQPRANAEAAWALKNYEEGKPFVFISYSHKNSELVLSIVKMLLDRGVRVWCDVESIPMGVNYSDWIAQKIVDSKVFVLNLSSNAFVSEYVRMELGLARRRGIKMFPILLEDIELPPGVDLEINSKQRLDWFNNTDEHNIDMIVRDLPREVFVDYEG